MRDRCQPADGARRDGVQPRDGSGRQIDPLAEIVGRAVQALLEGGVGERSHADEQEVFALAQDVLGVRFEGIVAGHLHHQIEACGEEVGGVTSDQAAETRGGIRFDALRAAHQHRAEFAAACLTSRDRFGQPPPDGSEADQANPQGQTFMVVPRVGHRRRPFGGHGIG